MMNRKFVNRVAFTCVLVGLPIALAAQPQRDADVRPEVFVLGLYHMANPGSDVFNTKADDVLAPKRQAEIAEVVALLKRFEPTKIAVEAAFHDGRIRKQYGEYVEGKLPLSRNEVHQLGFRLAKDLGHPAVYPVDVSGDYPFLRLVKYAKATERSKDLDAVLAKLAEVSKSTDTFLAGHTVLESLLLLNSDERVKADMAQYFQYAEFGEAWDWAGADLVADWMRRNMRIYTNIVRLIESPQERVLVIYGSGHLGWLQQAVAENPNLRLRKLAEFMN